MGALLPAMMVAIPVVMFATTIISLQLALADSYQLSMAQTSTLVAVSFFATNAVGLTLSVIYKQPIYLVTSSTCIVFLASFAGTYSYPSVLGATMIAGIFVCLLGLLGLTGRLTDLIPVPVAHAVVSGLLLPFVIRTFSIIQDRLLVVGTMVLVYIVSLRFGSRGIPPILPAVIAAVTMALITGEIGSADVDLGFPDLELTRPTFSFNVILTITPMLVILIAGLANISGVLFLQREGFDAPERVVQVSTGLSTMGLAFLAPIPMNIGYIWVPLLSSKAAGRRRQRYFAVVIISAVLITLSFSASVLAAIPTIVGVNLLYAIVGLALVDVVSNTVPGMFKSSLRLSPLFAFVIAQSELSLLGLGSAFWALFVGVVLAWTIERPALDAYRKTERRA